MFRHSCGQELRDEAEVCTRCGMLLRSAASFPPAPPAPAPSPAPPTIAAIQHAPECGGRDLPVTGDRCLFCDMPATAEAPCAAPVLLLPGGVRLPLDRPLVLGRTGGEPEIERALAPFGDVSRLHAEVSWREGSLTVRALSERNPTYVDGVRIDRAATIPLLARTVLRLGPSLEVMIAIEERS